MKFKNMKNTNVLIAVITLFIIASVAWWAYSNKSSETPRYMSIENYVKTDISTLSPIKEVLGGKFYVTKIETHGGSGTVEYEDGHNAYTADFTYTINDEGKSSIETFVLRK